MKGFNKLNGVKNLKFYSRDRQQILEALELLENLGYKIFQEDFSVEDAAKYSGVCAWDDGEITTGWLDAYSGFKQVTLEDLKQMVGETNMCNNILSNNFTVAWEQVFGEKFVDSVIKAVKQNKDSNMKNDMFTLERLLGCEVKFNYSGVTGYVVDVLDNDLLLHICCGNSFEVVSKYHLTFFTEDGDELTFDEYVQLYYPKG